MHTHVHTHTHTHTLSLSLSHTHTHTHSLSLSYTHIHTLSCHALKLSELFKIIFKKPHTSEGIKILLVRGNCSLRKQGNRKGTAHLSIICVATRKDMRSPALNSPREMSQPPANMEPKIMLLRKTLAIPWKAPIPTPSLMLR